MCTWTRSSWTICSSVDSPSSWHIININTCQTHPAEVWITLCWVKFIWRFPLNSYISLKKNGENKEHLLQHNSAVGNEFKCWFQKFIPSRWDTKPINNITVYLFEIFSYKIIHAKIFTAVSGSVIRYSSRPSFHF